MTSQPFTTCLWFDTEAEEAATFYTSTFKDARLGNIARYGDGGPRPAGAPFSASHPMRRLYILMFGIIDSPYGRGTR